jgi:hypothetical protein
MLESLLTASGAKARLGDPAVEHSPIRLGAMTPFDQRDAGVNGVDIERGVRGMDPIAEERLVYPRGRPTLGESNPHLPVLGVLQPRVERTDLLE